MFQNEQIAKDAANVYFKELIRRGVRREVAARRSLTYEANRLAGLNKWTRENVGLD